ncbi:nwd2 [Moniliophthora roreri MCA 2997]|nr:nwd2 [Moniliophthora roreri MCA 2997]
MFANARSFQINDGQFNVAGRDIIQTWYSVDPLQALWYAIKDVGATHNSEIRQPPPKCHPDTRQEVLVVLHDWIYSPWHSEPVFWLYGPAGAGKSAIAQTLAELGQQERYLASSFFFSRLHPRKNNASTLFLSIAYELAASTPELQEPVGQAIKRNPAIIQASLEEQFQKLIVEPCRLLQQLHSHVWVIIIDGLDECIGSREQKRILAILATALPKGIHLRFLVCSRPEPPIREAFDTDAFRPYLRRVALDWTFNPGRDIKTFLTNEFERIRNDPRNTHIQFPVPWPATGIIEELVQKSSGQFIYPATVVKFVDNEYTDPCMQLQSVLHPVPHPSSELISPFHDLDVLYRHILSCNPQRSKVREIIWALTLIPMSKTTLRRTPREVGALLLFDAGEIISALRGMHSIFEIGGPDDFIRPLHASFDDFLRDATRSGYYYMGDARNQHTLLTRWLLRAFTLYTGTNMKKTSER